MKFPHKLKWMKMIIKAAAEEILLIDIFFFCNTCKSDLKEIRRSVNYQK